jgi:hypothetical protein
MTTQKDVMRVEQARRRRMNPRRNHPRFAAKKKEAAKQRLSERQQWNNWMNSELHTPPRSRKAWAKLTFDRLVARGVIADWAWARGERSFIFPMTSPALTEDQLACVLMDFFHWDERQPVEIEQRDPERTRR